MKLVTFTHNKQSRVGAVVDDEVVDSQRLAPRFRSSMIEFLEAGSQSIARDAGTHRQG
jgi:hypothetical protein